jgi:VIT1/CCC1 family predicted Fe2+/Mn2+ transporter
MFGQNGRSFSEVLQDIVANVQEIVRSEFQWAKADVKEEVGQAAKAAAPLAAGIAFGIYGLGFLLLALMYALATLVSAWLAALIMSVFVTVIAVALIGMGEKRLRGGRREASQND